jgi:uncharacterized BrkB/YihY/UPF0761 family membrane protein
MIPDLINAAFEGFAALFILNHCRALWKSKQAHGVSLLSTVFFTTWGLWNIFYYPHIGQNYSFKAGLAVVSANFIWVYLIWKVRRLEKK